MEKQSGTEHKAVKLKTSRFGELSIRPDQAITFPEGLIGFNDRTRFAILEHKPGSPFQWLQSLEDPELAFIIIDPGAFRPDYAPRLQKADLESLELREQARDARFYAMVVVPEDPRRMYANLLGPLAVNPRQRLGKQVILSADTYSTCHYIVDEMKAFYGGAHAGSLAQTE